ncbi:K(+)/H(+) antiporter [Coemansia spiralis]|nr:K(+)/H(+) antiporter [Coemansia spiralis]
MAAEVLSVISGRNPVHYSDADPLALFIIQVLIIVCLGRLLHVVLRRLHQPTVISEVVGGILLGPSVLGRWGAFATNVFPKESLVNLRLVANLGLVLFLFIVGLELDPRILRRNLRSSLVISLAGMALPFGLGIAASYALYTLLLDSQGKFSTLFLLIGVAMSITAFPVLGRVLSEQNLLSTTVGSISMSAAAIDDVVSWCLLALIVALANNSSGLSALWVFLAGAGYALAVVFLVRPVYVWYLRRNGILGGREPKQSVLFVTFTLVLMSSYFTDIIGIHSIFGAFIVGVIVPHDGGFAIKVTETIEDVVQIYFLPVYFALSGFKTNIGDLNSGKTWGLFFLVCVVAFSGKMIGCSVAARLSKYTWRESITIGAMMNCKGLIEMIVLNIGLDAGVINTQIFSMMVLVALVTTVTTMPLTAWLYPARYQKRIDDTYSHLDEDESLVDKSANAGPPLGVLVVLSRLQQVPALMTLLGYLHHQPEFSAARKLAASDGDTGGGVLASVQSRLYRPIRVFGLRLLEHTGRESSVMQHFDAATRVASDPVMAMFRAFAHVAHMVFHAALTRSDREHFVDNILHSAQDADAELTIVSAFGRGAATSDAAAAAAKKADAITPASLESMGWGFTAEQQAAFAAALFDRAGNSMCVFIDCGLTSSTDMAPENSGTGHAEAAGHADVLAAQVARVSIAAGDAPSDVPGVVAARLADGRRVPVVAVPFFGGPDDRQALQVAVDLCTHSAVRVVVWRFIKSGLSTTSRGVAVHSPGLADVLQTPATVPLRPSEGDEINPWETKLNDDGRERALALAETRVEDEAALNEAAERDEDDAFIDAHLRPNDGAPDRHGRRGSAVSVHAMSESGAYDDSSAPLALAPTMTRETSASAYTGTPRGDERGGIRSRITQRLRFRRLATWSSDVLGRGGWDGVGAGALTLTEGVRATQFPNMTIKTTVAEAPLQMLLQFARTLSASDLIICGRSVRVCFPYHSLAPEPPAARHAHRNKPDLQTALGVGAEHLLESGIRASLLVAQASPAELDASGAAAAATAKRAM